MQAFVERMAFMHTNLAVVTGMVAEVAAISAALLDQLLAKLRSNIQLPECLRVIGYLRRLGIFSEQVRNPAHLGFPGFGGVHGVLL